jgi:hypothetical protein
MDHEVRGAGERLHDGTAVEVEDRFDLSFHPGFVVAGSSPEGYRLRRMSDGVELPVPFAADRVRPAPPHPVG